MEIVQSVERTLTILELLSDYNQGLGITDISTKVKLHKSTVHRLLGTLIHKGYVIQDPSTNKYKITLKLYELGSKNIESLDLLSVSRPFTQVLAEELNEVVHLVIRDNESIVYIDKIEADNTITMASRIGKRMPLYCTSVGKAMLAHMTDEEVEKAWNRSNIVKYTENTITDFNDFKKELQKIREQGYAVDNEENEFGVRCIGAVILNRFGEIEGAISVSGPTMRLTMDKVEGFAKKVIKCADLISRELGYKG